MSLKVVKDGREGSNAKGTEQERLVIPEKTFILQVKNQKGQVGYVMERDNRVEVIFSITPDVLKFEDYDDAKRYANSIKGSQVKILGTQAIEKILEQQGVRELDVVPMAHVDKNIFHVVVEEKESKNQIGYLSYRDNNYFIIHSTEGAAFWDEEQTVDQFIEQMTGMLPEGLIMKKKKYN